MSWEFNYMLEIDISRIPHKKSGCPEGCFLRICVHPKRHPDIYLCGISKNLNLKLIIEFFHLLIIPMTLFIDIMPNFNEFKYMFMVEYKYIVIPLKNLDTQKFYNCQF